MTTTPLAFFWGDDELVGGAGDRRLPESPRGREWRADGSLAGPRRAQRGERHRCEPPRARRHPGDVRWRHPGRRAQRRLRSSSATRIGTRSLRRSRSWPPATRWSSLDASQSGAKGPAPKRVADAIAAVGGTVRQFKSPREGALAGWIEAEAREPEPPAGAGRRQGAGRADRWLRPRGRRGTRPADPSGLDGARQARALPRHRADRSGRRRGPSSARPSRARSGRSPMPWPSGGWTARSRGSIGFSSRPPSRSSSPSSTVACAS